MDRESGGFKFKYTIFCNYCKKAEPWLLLPPATRTRTHRARTTIMIARSAARAWRQQHDDKNYPNKLLVSPYMDEMHRNEVNADMACPFRLDSFVSRMAGK